MGMALLALVLGAAIDESLPAPPMPAVGANRSTTPADVGPTVSPVHVVPCPVDGYAYGYAARPGGMYCARHRAGTRLPGIFGYCHYYALIPCHGPTRYDYRVQFDYPWRQ